MRDHRLHLVGARSKQNRFSFSVCFCPFVLLRAASNKYQVYGSSHIVCAFFAKPELLNVMRSQCLTNCSDFEKMLPAVICWLPSVIGGDCGIDARSWSCVYRLVVLR